MGGYNDGELVLDVKPRKVGCLIPSFMHPKDHMHQQCRPEEEVYSPSLLKFEREGVKIMKNVKLRIACLFRVLICYFELQSKSRFVRDKCWAFKFHIFRHDLDKVPALPPAHSPRNASVFHPEETLSFVDSLAVLRKLILFVSDSSPLKTNVGGVFTMCQVASHLFYATII